MDPTIPISVINDFIFCPKSIYLRNIYASFNASAYNDSPQITGVLAHYNIDQGVYSTSKHILQGMSVYCARLGVKGKIDLFDIKKKTLIERKYRVKRLYKGFIYQLYAQMYCLIEMGYEVQKMFIHSLSDNKRYEVNMPSNQEQRDFEEVIKRIKLTKYIDIEKHSCLRCRNHIYGLFDW